MAEVRAVAKFVKVQPRKVRIIADEVRGKAAQQMVDVLRFHPSKGADYLRNVIISAIANAVENEGLDPRTLTITRVQVDEGPTLKRITARSMGRANRILKKMSHITVMVGDEWQTAESKPAPTAKVKQRRTLAKPVSKKKAAAASVGKADESAVEAVEEKVEAAEAPAADQPQAEEESK